MRWARDDSGGATVEFALVMPALVMLLGLVVGVAGWTATAVRTTSAAAAAARVAAVDSDAHARQAAARHAPDARIEIAREGGWVTATATSDAWALPFTATATFQEAGQ